MVKDTLEYIQSIGIADVPSDRLFSAYFDTPEGIIEGQATMDEVLSGKAFPKEMVSGEECTEKYCAAYAIGKTGKKIPFTTAARVPSLLLHAFLKGGGTVESIPDQLPYILGRHRERENYRICRGEEITPTLFPWA